ncbi:MAG: hypothetical protein DHS20C05_02580 [Hyphococcus sp.]|nr:MAG: hypothetical protein DHS20C05_02580 [Marinicaulis sp.]
MSASGTERRVRKHIISIRASDDEKHGIRARANAHGLSVGAFLRASALSKPLPRITRFSKEEGQFIALVLASVAALMDEVRRLDNDEAHQRLHKQLLFVRDHCVARLGRRP